MQKKNTFVFELISWVKSVFLMAKILGDLEVFAI